MAATQLEAGDSVEPLFGEQPAEPAEFGGAPWRRRRLPLAASLAGLAAAALLSTRSGASWGLGAGGDALGAPLVREFSEVGCTVELFEQEGFAGPNVSRGVGAHPGRQRVRSLRVRGGCTAILSGDVRAAFPWLAYTDGSYSMADVQVAVPDGWVHSLLVIPGQLARPACDLELLELESFSDDGAMPGTGDALNISALNEYVTLGTSSLEARGNCSLAYAGAAGFSLRWTSLAADRRGYNNEDSGAWGAAQFPSLPSWVLPAGNHRLLEPTADHPWPIVQAAGLEGLAMVPNQQAVSPPKCTADLYEYHGGGDVLKVPVGVGLHLGDELVKLGFAAGVGAIQVHGSCTALWSESGDFSLPWTYHVNGSLDMQAMRARGSPLDRVGAVLLLPGRLGEAQQTSDGAPDTPAAPPPQGAAGPVPPAVFVAGWVHNMTGELLDAWAGNMGFFPPGTQVKHFSATQMELSVREISDALSRAGVVHGAYEAFRSLRPMAFRADLWRYMILWQQGGMYFDPAMQLMSRVEDWIDVGGQPAASSLWLVKDYTPSGFYPALMAATPRSPLLERVLRYVVGGLLRRAHPKDQLALTGPGAIGKALGVYGVRGGPGNWTFAGFSELAKRGPAPKVFARLSVDWRLRVVSLATGMEERVLAVAAGSASQRLAELQLKHGPAYCDDPGDPCPPPA